MTALLCEGRVCLVTGAGRGIGRETALLLAEHGAKVVVNDVGANADGFSQSPFPADVVADEIGAFGGQAVANHDDISTWDGAHHAVGTAIGRFGGIDVVVNNAGILRDRMLVNMSIEDWDAVVAVHLRGTFAVTRWAASYWRDQTKAGRITNARVVNTTSASGLYGNPGQANYGAAKAGVAAFTLIAAGELARYGVTVNAIAPLALTRLTEHRPADVGDTEEERERLHPRYVAATTCWLASTRSAGISGRVLAPSGRSLAILAGWHEAVAAPASDDPWEVDHAMDHLINVVGPVERQSVLLDERA